MQLNFNYIELTMSAGFMSQFPKDGLPQIAFAGKSNVGKSSLINMLCGRKALARKSASPGKTQTINFFKIGKESPLYFVDLPGYGYAEVSKAKRNAWGELIDSYLAENKNLMLFFQLLDARHDPTELDKTILNWLRANRIPHVAVFTKSDKLNKTELESRKLAAENNPLLNMALATIFASSSTKTGRDDMINIIHGLF